MRTNIDIDDKLIGDVLEATGLKTKKEAVDYALKAVMKLEGQKKLRELSGRYGWEGDLDKMRTDK